ncbi:MAG: prepilin-type N-terminal cleavage/methylation domain-containing protein [Dissulfuribacterales bacterium]
MTTKARHSLKQENGFTLMEVLIATAITGIALGVILSIISQGHREFFRGVMAEEAGNIANQLILQLSSTDEWKNASGSLDTHSDWSYEMIPQDEITVRDIVPGIGEREIKVDELLAADIILKAPQEAGRFSFSAYYPKTVRQETVKAGDSAKTQRQGAGTNNPFLSSGPAPFPFGR